nr:retrovirus-related Pol polyprotein from transposon TNT 1-94 [Tanacetum cinerariifolium]
MTITLIKTRLTKSLKNLLENQTSDKVKTELGYKVASPIVENFVNSSEILENRENVKSISDKGYHAVPPPYTGNYIPPKPDLMFIDEQVKSDYVDVVSNVASSDVKIVEPKHESVDVKNKGVYNTIETKHVRKNSFSPPIIEDWNSNDESEVEFVPKVEIKTVRPSIEKIKLVKSAREKVEKIMREFNVARTPQQNVNTAYYVLNRALVIKPYNKTPYELIRGRPPLIHFMKPFGCPVTILNTRDHLGKFDRKADEGFFYRVLFGQAEKKKEPKQEYNLIPIYKTDLLISQGPKDNAVDAGKKELNSPVSTVGPSFANTALPSPINAVGTPASTNAFKEHPFERFSPFKTAFSLPHVPIVTPINDTIILVFRNKKDERGIVVKNKAKLVAQGHTQEDGINYDEVFTPVARIEAIRLFLAYASFKDFIVYQMDVKSAFLYEKIKEEVYVCQPLGFKDLDFLDKVYKVDKALYRLHQAPRAWYETLLIYLMDNGFHRGQIDKTMFIKRHKDNILLVQVYVDDINFGLTKKELNTPKISYLYAVKRIFRYLKGQPKLGLWYPRDSPFDLEAYSDSDCTGAILDRKFTIGGCQFLGKRLISWQCKKQTIVAKSTTEAEYVAAANCCRQVLWIQN